MYKKRLKDWGYRKYTPRQVDEDYAENPGDCNGEVIIRPDEGLEVHPVPVKQDQRFLKRKNTDGEHSGSMHRPQRLSIGFSCLRIGLTNS
jgi:hypothetical protein